MKKAKNVADRTGMKRTCSAENVEDLVKILHGFGPTRRTLERATAKYLAEVKTHRRGMYSSQPSGHALQPPNREQRGLLQ